MAHKATCYHGPQGHVLRGWNGVFVCLILFLEVLFYFILLLFEIGVNASESHLTLTVWLNF